MGSKYKQVKLMAKEKKKHALWFEPGEQMDSLMRMEEDIHRMMHEFWRKPFDFKVGISGLAPKMRTIPIDLSESDSELIARADLPGFNKDEIRLKVTESTIEISAEKKRQVIEREKTFFRQERSFGSMKRAMTLPYAIKPGETKAKFENGVLTVVMPKAEKRKVKEIKPE